jgi:hypothetical protein
LLELRREIRPGVNLLFVPEHDLRANPRSVFPCELGLPRKLCLCRSSQTEHVRQHTRPGAAQNQREHEKTAAHDPPKSINCLALNGPQPLRNANKPLSETGRLPQATLLAQLGSFVKAAFQARWLKQQLYAEMPLRFARNTVQSC